MDPAALAHQAVVAEEGGNPQLAENFLRAAELAIIDDEEVMSLYEALRPHRSTAERVGGAAGLAGDARARPGARNWCGRPPSSTPGGVCCGDGRCGRGRRDRRRQPHHRDRAGPRARRGRRARSRTGRRRPAGARDRGNRWRARRRCCTGSRSTRAAAADELLLSALRPVDTATAPMPPPSSPRSPVRSLRKTGREHARRARVTGSAGTCRWPP